MKVKIIKLWSVLLALVMLVGLLPTMVLAAEPTAPELDGSTLYANGFPILIEAGETSGTTVKYDSDKTAPYDYETELTANNETSLTVYAGGNDKGINTASVLMTGGNVGTIYGGGYTYGDYTSVSSVEITINGGNVGTIYGGGYARWMRDCPPSSSVGTATITVTGGAVSTLYASSAYAGRETSNSVASAIISVTGGTIVNIKENAGKSNNANGNTVNITGFLITGGSIASSDISLMPTNAEETQQNVVKNEITFKDKDETNTVPNELLSALTTDAGYTYGMNDVKTNASGKIYVWLPEGASVSGAKSVSGDEYEVGSATGILKQKDTYTVTMQKGASIRLNKQNGIRFYTTVDATKLAELKKVEGNVVELGTLIAPADLVTGELTHEIGEANYVDVSYKADTFFAENTFVGSIVNIKPANYGRAFIGRGYIKVTNGSDVTYYYAKQDDNARSVKAIAQSYIDDANSGYNTLDSKTKELVDNWALAADWSAQ